MPPPLHTRTKMFTTYGRKRTFHVASIYNWPDENLTTENDDLPPLPERLRPPLSPKKSVNVLPNLRVPLSEKTPKKGPTSFRSISKTPSPVVFVKPRKGGRPLVVRSPTTVSPAAGKRERRRKPPPPSPLKSSQIIVIDGDDEEPEVKDAGNWEDCEIGKRETRPRRVRRPSRACKLPRRSSLSTTLSEQSRALRPLLDILSQDSPRQFKTVVEQFPLLERGTWSKIGEATFSEVYIVQAGGTTAKEVVVKIIPLSEDVAPQWERGPDLSSPEDVIREISVMRQVQNVEGFVGLLG
jgi:hypothetical protein